MLYLVFQFHCRNCANKKKSSTLLSEYSISEESMGLIIALNILPDSNVWKIV